MFLRIPPQFIRSINYVTKCQGMLHTSHCLVYLYFFVIHVGKLGYRVEHTWWNILIIFIDIISLNFHHGEHQYELWRFSIVEARNENLSTFITSSIPFTLFLTGLNLWHANGFFFVDNYCNGFDCAYSAFMKGTLVGSGFTATFFGVAFVFISVLNIRLNLQAYILYRNLRDDLYRRNG